MDFYETTYNGSVVHSKVKVEGDWIPTWASTKKMSLKSSKKH